MLIPNKPILILMIVACSTSLFAQEVKGVVRDINSRMPIANAKVITPKATILTNNEGKFLLSGIKLGTIVAVRIMGYATLELAINKLTDTLHIYLKQDAITLNEVQIKTKRNYKLDSLDIRKEYDNAFANKRQGFSDMFIGRDPNYDSPFGFTNSRSTASLVSLNVLQVF